MSKEIGKTVLKFVGHSIDGTSQLEPSEYIIEGNRKIVLPSAEEQRKGFSLETEKDTLTVARLFPRLYKKFVVKGE